MGGVRCLGLFPKKNRFFFLDDFPKSFFSKLYSNHQKETGELSSLSETHGSPTDIHRFRNRADLLIIINVDVDSE